MIRTKVVPDNRIVTVSFSVPDNYIGQEMEVIAFTSNEGADTVSDKEVKVSFSAIAIDTKAYKFDRDEANGR